MHMHMHMHIHIHIHIHISVGHARALLRANVYMHSNILSHTYIHLITYVHTCTHTYTQVHILIYMYTYFIHVCINRSFSGGWGGQERVHPVPSTGAYTPVKRTRTSVRVRGRENFR
jgi:hypothetical protein